VALAVHGKRGVQAGARLRNARREKGLTQRELASEAGIGIGTLRDLEQGRVMSPQPDTVARLGRILGLQDQRQPRPGGLWIGVLGPLAVFRDGRSVTLRTAGQRAILGLLALGCGGAVRQDALVDALWGGNPPRSATATVHCYISRLRSILNMPGGAVLFREASGYRLSVGARQLDLIAFRQLAEEARRAAASEGAVEACRLYRQAASLWRGEPGEDLDALHDHPEAAALSEERLALTVEYARLVSGLGWYDLVLPELRKLTARHPLDERLHAALMTALAGTGRQAEAFRAYDSVCRRLKADFGVSPGDELRAARTAVIRKQVPAARSAPDLWQDDGVLPLPVQWPDFWSKQAVPSVR
jgi:DNA-binding SARP family transcriptional activator/DNA-binding XRE family transcriptional regulator